MANTAQKALKKGAIDPSKALPVVFRILGRWQCKNYWDTHHFEQALI